MEHDDILLKSEEEWAGDVDHCILPVQGSKDAVKRPNRLEAGASQVLHVVVGLPL